jgi:hypothetical protein
MRDLCCTTCELSFTSHALCLTPRAPSAAGHRWQLAPSLLCPSQAARQERVVTLPFSGSTSSSNNPWARQILIFPIAMSSFPATVAVNSTPPVSLMSTSSFSKDIRSMVHLSDRSVRQGLVFAAATATTVRRHRRPYSDPLLTIFLDLEPHRSLGKLTSHQKLRLAASVELVTCRPPRRRLLSSPTNYDEI